MRIVEINDINEFYNFRSKWNKVLDTTNDNTLFLSWERMAPAVEYLLQGSKLKILCAIDGEEILGIMPLKQNYRFLKGIPIYNVVDSLSYRALGVLLTKRKAECLNMFLSHLYNQKDWDFLYLDDVPDTFSIVNLLKKNSSSIPDFEFKEGAVSPYLTIPSSLDELFKGLHTNFRKSVQRKSRKIERELGKMELKDYYELGTLDEMMQVFFDLHQKRWNSIGEPGAFRTDVNRKMFLYEAKLFSEINCLRLRFLVINNKPIAVFYGFEYKHVLYYLLGGFDPAYSLFSPSYLLELKIIEQCIEENITELNFFGGYSTYKFNWCKDYRRNYTFRFVNRKISSKLINQGIHVAEKLKLTKLMSKFILL